MTYSEMTLSQLVAAFPEATMDDQWEIACAACSLLQSEADATLAIETFGERTVGEFVADWADGAAYHPAESSGAAFMSMDDGNAIFAEWTDSGFWYVTIETVGKCESAIEEMNDEWREEEESEEEESDAE